ncbi:MAG: Ig-like domain-containing protein [Chloroflexi bacterium]|nr:Ig-like domain-containing protein [Chloroflexota bacterium]
MEQNTEMAVSPSGAATCGRRRHISVRPAFLLALAALAVLAVLLTGGVAQGQEQENQVTPATPAAPTVALRSCDTGCLIVDAGTLTYTDETALTLPAGGTYSTAAGDAMPLLEAQWRIKGTSDWAAWDYTASPKIHWRVRRNDVGGHFEVRNLNAAASYEVRVRVRDPEDPANAVSGWSSAATATPTAWPGVANLQVDNGQQSGSDYDYQRSVFVSWEKPSGDPGYTAYYVSVSAVRDDRYDCHTDLNPDYNAEKYRNGRIGLMNHVLDNKLVTGTSVEAELEHHEQNDPLRVCVRPVVGTGAGIQAANAETRATAPGVPAMGSPTLGFGRDFPIAGLNADGFYITWDAAPVFDEPITGSEWQFAPFDLVVVDKSGDEHFVIDWEPAEVVTGNQRWAEFDLDQYQLQHGRSYRLRVRSRTASGWGGWSETTYYSNVNHAPELAQPTGDMVLDAKVKVWDAQGNVTEPDVTRSVPLDGMFTDEDNHHLHLRIDTTDSDVAYAVESGGSLVVYAFEPGRATITVTASDGYGGVASDTFTVTVVDHYDIWVYDQNDNGRIDLAEYHLSVYDLGKCAEWAFPDENGNRHYNPDHQDAYVRLDCARDTGNAYRNVMRVRALYEGAHIRVSLSWGGGEGLGHAVVDEDDIVVTANVELHQPAPEGGVTYAVHMTGDIPEATSADAELLDDKIFIPADQIKGSVRIQVHEDGHDETVRERGGAEMHESFTIWVVAPDGTQLGRAKLSIRDYGYDGADGGSPIVICRNSSNDVVDCNSRPTVKARPKKVILTNEEATHTVSLRDVFADPDGDALTITATSNEAVATVALSANQSTLTVTAVARGTTPVTVMAEDADRAAVKTSFVVTVKAAPTLVDPADVEALIVGETRDVPLSVSDADQDTLTVTAGSSNGAAVQASVDGQRLTITGTGSGSATITVRVEDSDGNRDEAAFNVTALTADQHRRNINQAPTITGASIADMHFVRESGKQVVSLAGMFNDNDDDDRLTISVRSSDTAKVQASLSGDILTVAAISGGSATITVTASDGYGGAVSDTFTVTVKTAPVLASPIGDISNLEEGSTKLVPLAGVFRDADGDTLTIEAVSSYIYAATVTQNSGSLTVTAVAPGSATIGVYATDPDGNEARTGFEVTVVAAPQQAQPVPPAQPQKANQAPRLNGSIPDLTYINESVTENVHIGHRFSDPDGDDLTITAQSSSTSKATVSVSSDQSMLVVSAQSRGKATITVTASDGSATVSDTFAVTVKAAPVVDSPVGDVSSLEEGDEQAVLLSGVFRDPDGDDLDIFVESSNNLSVWISSGNVMVYGHSPGAGKVTLTARDPDYNEVQDSFTVTVVAAPEPEPEPEPDPPPKDNSSTPTPFGDVTDLKVGEIRTISLAGIYDELGDGWFYSTVGGFDQDVAWPWVECDSNDHCDPLKVEGVGAGAMSATLHFSNADSTEQRDYTFSVTVIE